MRDNIRIMNADAENCIHKIEHELSEGRISKAEADDFRRQVESKVEQKQKLLNDFAAKKVNETTFNQWQIAISGDLKKIAEDIDMAAIKRKKKEKKKKKLIRRAKVLGVLLLVAAVAVAFMLPQWLHAHRAIAGIPEPLQTSVDDALKEGRIDSARKTISGNGYKVDMSFLAEYDIKGLVVQLDDYDNAKDASAFDLAVPRDISMAWGKAAEFANRIKWGHVARTLNVEYPWDLLDEAGVNNIEFGTMYSNNHVIVDDGELRTRLKKVKRGDYIEMKGFLVSADFYDGDGRLVHSVQSSLVRTDHVEHPFDTRTSCEVIYLTDLQWLD